jgi:hypothetical protein
VLYGLEAVLAADHSERTIRVISEMYTHLYMTVASFITQILPSVVMAVDITVTSKTL